MKFSLNSCNPLSYSFGKVSCRAALASFALVAVVSGARASAQTASLTAVTSPAAYSEMASASVLALPATDADVSSSSALPNDPGSLFTPAGYGVGRPMGAPGTVAPKYKKYIPAGEQGQALDAHDKVIVGARDLYAVSSILAIVIDAGYSHVSNGQPNYGTNSKAFAKRLGATAIRDTSEGIFTDMVFAPIYHEDPRYYIEGPQYGFFHRAIYAATRPIITRTDSGHQTINAALLTGYAAGSALSYAYYPSINQNFKDTAATYGGSIGGAALGFFVSEFAPDVLKKLHINFQQ